MDPELEDIRLHSVLDTSTPRDEFDSAARWYSECGSTQTFRLFENETNQVPDHRPNARIEAVTSDWVSTGPDDWKEFTAHYMPIAPTESQRVLFQVKSGESAVNWQLQVYIDSDAALRIRHHYEGASLLMRDVFGKDFFLRVRSNGARSQTYINDELLSDETNEADPSGSASYLFRWGIYGGTVDKDYELEVQDAKFSI